jgi:ubiquinol-cytochrome c reductase cytochrome c1 subunit
MRKLALAVVSAFALGAAALSGPAKAAVDAPTPPGQDWPFAGLFGTFDRASLQRGFQVYKEVCAACHAMRQLSYRDLSALGFSEDEIRLIAEQYEVQDGPDDDGQMFMRPARASDRFYRPFPNEQAARAANNGAYPVDLSLIVKARDHGADYVHAVLTGYREPPAGVEVLPGLYYNVYFPGHQIAMAPPLIDGAVQFADGTAATVDQMAYDVTQFMAWAAEPELETRKRMGVQVILYLLVFTGVLYAVKRKVWSDVH